MYTENNIIFLLNSEAVTEKTRAVLEERIDEKNSDPIFFNKYQFDLLTMISDHLMAQNPKERTCNPAIAIDKRLAAGKADGWRYDTMPEDKVAFTLGLKGIDELSIAVFNKSFLQLISTEQHSILEKIQQGNIAGESWKNVSSTLFFEELLAEVTAIFYSHPMVQQQIGFVGMADAKGWLNIGLNSKDPIESDEIIINKII